MHAYRCHHSRLQGFTLIELAVVISIIALLIAILLPALRAARLTAQAAVCLSNQRQVGLALQMYAEDYDEHFPLWYDFVANRAWAEVLAGNGTYLPVANDVFFCPSAPPGNYQQADVLSSRPLRLGYGMPRYYTDYRVDFTSKPSGVGADPVSFVLRYKIKQPSDVFLAADTFNRVIQLQTYDIYYNDSNKAVHLRHGGSAQSVRADGSARASDGEYFSDAYWRCWRLTADGEVFQRHDP